MTIEYIAEGGDATPAVVICGRDWQACQSLEESFQHLAQGTVRQVAIHRIPRFEAEEGLTLTARAGEQDVGVALSGRMDFEAVLTPHAWSRVARAIQPFCRPLPEEQDSLLHLDRSGKIALTLATDKL